MIFQCDLKPLSERRKCVFRDPNFQKCSGGAMPSTPQLATVRFYARSAPERYTFKDAIIHFKRSQSIEFILTVFWTRKGTLLRHNFREINFSEVLRKKILEVRRMTLMNFQRIIYPNSNQFLSHGYYSQEKQVQYPLDYSCLADDESEWTEASSKKSKEITRFRTSLASFRY